MADIRQDITLVTLYTKRTGFMCGSPPLLNMALLNIKHWQSQSEQDQHPARRQSAVAHGVRAGGGARTCDWLIFCHFILRSAKAGSGYVEHTGSSIGAGKESLAELVEQMRQAGAKLLRTENTSTKSVDQTSEEKMQEQSPLYTMATSLEDAIDNILQIMAEYIGESEGGTSMSAPSWMSSRKSSILLLHWPFSRYARAVISVAWTPSSLCRS